MHHLFPDLLEGWPERKSPVTEKTSPSPPTLCVVFFLYYIVSCYTHWFSLRSRSKSRVGSFFLLFLASYRKSSKSVIEFHSSFWRKRNTSHIHDLMHFLIFFLFFNGIHPLLHLLWHLIPLTLYHWSEDEEEETEVTRKKTGKMPHAVSVLPFKPWSQSCLFRSDTQSNIFHSFLPISRFVSVSSYSSLSRRGGRISQNFLPLMWKWKRETTRNQHNLLIFFFHPPKERERERKMSKEHSFQERTPRETQWSWQAI